MNKLSSFLLILFKTGLQISEFCGLTIKDIDFKNGILNIDHQLQRTNGIGYVIESTKTSSGTSRIPMLDEVAEAFHRIINNRPKVKVEPIIDGYSGFLYLEKNNMPIASKNIRKNKEI
jgi:integrase